MFRQNQGLVNLITYIFSLNLFFPIDISLVHKINNLHILYLECLHIEYLDVCFLFIRANEKHLSLTSLLFQGPHWKIPGKFFLLDIIFKKIQVVSKSCQAVCWCTAKFQYIFIFSPKSVCTPNTSEEQTQGPMTTGGSYMRA